MGELIYYVAFGAIAFALGYLVFWLWDRKQSAPIIAAIQNGRWLTPVEEEGDAPEPLSPQASFDYAASYASALRGAFASATPAKLERLNALLASHHNLENQLWRDMPMRLREVFKSYGKEYFALLEAVADHSANPVQLYAAFRLATCLPEAPQHVRELGFEIGSNPAIKGLPRKKTAG
ncbi:hypothetical protein ACFO5Q_16225 [Kordiimonas lipolytica]|uniref:Uncharacterized protein n=1 Tax=Kordiimonas lipolytica TaxID=1662421 RepID=A0ABV8UE17_9PROT|nr:hypothetical protein [Kordiimonas lipolytica]